MSITFNSKTAKVIGVVSATLMLILLGLKYFDGDPTNDPKVQDVVDAGKAVYDSATGKVIETTTASATVSQ